MASPKSIIMNFRGLWSLDNLKLIDSFPPGLQAFWVNSWTFFHHEFVVLFGVQSEMVFPLWRRSKGGDPELITVWCAERDGLCALEEVEGWRALLGKPLGRGASRVAHRVLGTPATRTPQKWIVGFGACVCRAFWGGLCMPGNIFGHVYVG